MDFVLTETFDPKSLEKAFGITYLNTLEFIEPKILSKVFLRCKRKLKRAKHKKCNQWTQALYNQDLLAKRAPKLLIKKINPLIGYGVFANENIAPLRYIGEYTGVVRKRKKRKDKLNDFVFGYVVGPHDTPWVIDAKDKGNFTRFINHSYEPNLTSRWIISEGYSHIILFANRPIKKGAQLTYDYGPYYWKKRAYPMSI